MSLSSTVPATFSLKTDSAVSRLMVSPSAPWAGTALYRPSKMLSLETGLWKEPYMGPEYVLFQRALLQLNFGKFKSWTGGQGHATNITWEDITVVNVSTAIFITQKYGFSYPCARAKILTGSQLLRPSINRSVCVNRPYSTCLSRIKASDLRIPTTPAQR